MFKESPSTMILLKPASLAHATKNVMVNFIKNVINEAHYYVREFFFFYLLLSLALINQKSTLPIKEYKTIFCKSITTLTIYLTTLYAKIMSTLITVGHS
jgi:hypothetical protein